jgi:hypothetical protein
MKTSFWFRPARFWKWFAFYYPVSKEGWIATIILLAIAFATFFSADVSSHSISDTLIGFAPWFIMIATAFDLLCFRFGEYPSWWRKKPEGKRARK